MYDQQLHDKERLMPTIPLDLTELPIDWQVADSLSDRFPREFRAWVNMLAKCYDPSHPEFSSEGGAGVKVAKQWRESFGVFLDDMGPMPDA